MGVLHDHDCRGRVKGTMRGGEVGLLARIRTMHDATLLVQCRLELIEVGRLGRGQEVLRINLVAVVAQNCAFKDLLKRMLLI